MSVTVEEFTRLRLRLLAAASPPEDERFVWQPGDVTVVPAPPPQTPPETQPTHGQGEPAQVHPHIFSQAWHDAVTRAAPLVNDLQSAYQGALNDMVQSAASRLDKHAQRYVSINPETVTADASPPTWAIPDQQTIYDDIIAQLKLKSATDPQRYKIAETVANDVAAQLGLSFDAKNALLHDAFDQFGQKITGVAESQRSKIMSIIQEGYDKGLSVPDTAAKLTAEGGIDSMMRATRIARTEFIGGVNGASLAGASQAGIKYKQWVATNDSRTRDDHAAADGQVVANDQPFDVGGENLMYPGDPNGSADEIINCRCTLIYADGPTGSSTPIATQFGPGSPFAPGGWNPNLAAISQALPSLGDLGGGPEVFAPLPFDGAMYLKEESRAFEDAPLTPEEQNALNEYRGEGYAQINPALRKGYVPSKDVGRIDSAISKNRLEHPATVYRGMSKSQVEKFFLNNDPESAVGKIVSDKGFVSTSDDPEATKYFGASQVRIHLPTDTNFAFGHGGEFERILPRESQFEISQVTKEGDQWLVDANYMPPESVPSSEVTTLREPGYVNAEGLQIGDEVEYGTEGDYSYPTVVSKGEDGSVKLSNGQTLPSDKNIYLTQPAPPIEPAPAMAEEPVVEGETVANLALGPVDDSQVYGVGLYKNDTAYKSIQQALRNGSHQYDAEVQEAESQMLPIEKPAVVYRETQDFKALGVSNPQDIKVGQTFTEKGFTSTTWDKNLGMFGHDKYVIELPQGQPVFNMDRIKPDYMAHDKEREVLLPTDMTYRVESVDPVVKYSFQTEAEPDHYEVHLSVVPKEPSPAMAEGEVPGAGGVAQPYKVTPVSDNLYTVGIGTSTADIGFDPALGWSQGFQSKRADDIAQALAKLDEKQFQQIGEVFTSSGDNPENGLLAQKYGVKQFKSAANYKDGKITFFNGKFSPGTISHEAGHAIGDAGQLEQEWFSEAEWNKLPDSWKLPYQGGPVEYIDNHLVGGQEWSFAALDDSELSYTGQVLGDKASIFTPTPGKLGVTKYGQTLINEDWAESVRLYQTDNANFRAMFPNRAKILDKLFEKEEVAPVAPEVPIPEAPQGFEIWQSDVGQPAAADYSNFSQPKSWAVNDWLRGKDPMSKSLPVQISPQEAADLTSQLDQEIASMPESTKPMAAFRGVGPGAKIDISPGAEFTDPGFGSLSPDYSIAEGYSQSLSGGEDGPVLRIVMKPGTKAVVGDAEHPELILPRGTTYKFTDGLLKTDSEGNQFYQVVATPPKDIPPLPELPKSESDILTPQEAPKESITAPVATETAIPDYGLLAVTGNAGGSTGAKFAVDIHGQKLIAKSYDGDQNRIATELLSNRIMSELGVPVPDGGIGELNGQRVFAAKLSPGVEKSQWSLAMDKSMSDTYAANAYLANWDAVGLVKDNVLWDGQSPTLIDQGGTLFYRAQGGAKAFAADDVPEMKSLATGQFKGMLPSDADLAKQAQHIATVMTDDKIESLVDQAGFGDNMMRVKVDAALKGRRDWMADYASEHGYPVLEAVAPKIEGEPAVLAGKTEAQVKDQAGKGLIFQSEVEQWYAAHNLPVPDWVAEFVKEGKMVGDVVAEPPLVSADEFTAKVVSFQEPYKSQFLEKIQELTSENGGKLTQKVLDDAHTVIMYRMVSDAKKAGEISQEVFAKLTIDIADGKLNTADEVLNEINAATVDTLKVGDQVYLDGKPLEVMQILNDDAELSDGSIVPVKSVDLKTPPTTAINQNITKVLSPGGLSSADKIYTPDGEYLGEVVVYNENSGLLAYDNTKGELTTWDTKTDPVYVDLQDVQKWSGVKSQEVVGHDAMMQAENLPGGVLETGGIEVYDKITLKTGLFKGGEGIVTGKTSSGYEYTLIKAPPGKESYEGQAFHIAKEDAEMAGGTTPEEVAAREALPSVVPEGSVEATTWPTFEPGDHFWFQNQNWDEPKEFIFKEYKDGHRYADYVDSGTTAQFGKQAEVSENNKLWIPPKSTADLKTQLMKQVQDAHILPGKESKVFAEIVKGTLTTPDQVEIAINNVKLDLPVLSDVPYNVEPPPLPAPVTPAASPVLSAQAETMSATDFVNELDSMEFSDKADEPALLKYVKYQAKLKDKMVIVTRDENGDVLGLTRYDKSQPPDAFLANTYVLHEDNRDAVLRDIVKAAQGQGKSLVRLQQTAGHEAWLDALGFYPEPGYYEISTEKLADKIMPLVAPPTPTESMVAKDFYDQIQSGLISDFAPGAQAPLTKYAKYQAGLADRQLLVVRDDNHEITGILAYQEPAGSTLTVNAYTVGTAQSDQAVTEAAKLASEKGATHLVILEPDKGLGDITTQLQNLGFQQEGKGLGIDIQNLDVQHGGTMTKTLSISEPAKPTLEVVSGLSSYQSAEYQDWLKGLANEKWAPGINYDPATFKFTVEGQTQATGNLSKYGFGYGSKIYIQRDSEGRIEGMFVIRHPDNVGNFVSLQTMVLAPGREDDLVQAALKAAHDSGKGVWIPKQYVKSDELAAKIEAAGFKTDYKNYQTGYKMLSTTVKGMAKKGGIKDVGAVEGKVAAKEAVDLNTLDIQTGLGTQGNSIWNVNQLGDKPWADKSLFSQAESGDKLLVVNDNNGNAIGEVKLGAPKSAKNKGMYTFFIRTDPKNPQALEATLRAAAKQAAQDGKGLGLVAKDSQQQTLLEALGFHPPTDPSYKQYTDWRQLTKEEAQKLANGEFLPPWTVPVKAEPSVVPKTSAGLRQDLIDMSRPAPNWEFSPQELRQRKTPGISNFQSKSTNLINTMTSSVKSALNKYSGHWASQINLQLRKGHAISDADMARVKAVDKIMTNDLEMPPGFTTWRVQSIDENIKHELAKFNQKNPHDPMKALMEFAEEQYPTNFELDAKQYFSSQVTPEAFGTFEGQLVMEIKPLPGRGIYMKGVSSYSNEDEFLLPRDAKYRVVGVDYAKTKRGSKFIALQLEQIS